MSDQKDFPEGDFGDFYLTTKTAAAQKFALESYPVTLKKISNFTGVFWKATPTDISL